ncbi:MAG: ABC transporter permease [Anaerolineae bacterium]|nr:ABC transporter permease [Anaerolineae bacterium]
MSVNPLGAYAALFDGAVGNVSALGTTITKALPLLIGGVGVTIAYRAGIFNIGVEGQIILGGIFATWVSTKVIGLPSWLHLILALTAGAIGGMTWAFLPGWLKAVRGINEVIVSLLMNFVAALLLSWIVRGPLQEPGQAYAKTAEVAESARLPLLWPELRLHLGFFFALVIIAFGYWLLWRTTLGFRIRYVGVNPRAAEAAGIPVARTMLTAMLLSGSIAGLAGAVHLLGSEYRMLETFLQGAGYDSIAAALVGALHPFGVFVAGFFFGALRAGSNNMQISVGIPVTLLYIIQALIILFILASYHIRYGRRWWYKERATEFVSIKVSHLAETTGVASPVERVTDDGAIESTR